MDAPRMMLALQILFGLIAGGVIGIAHLRTLAPSVRWMTEGRAGAAVALQLARMALLTLALLGLALIGPAALIAGAAGLLLTRTLMIQRVRKDRA